MCSVKQSNDTMSSIFFSPMYFIHTTKKNSKSEMFSFYSWKKNVGRSNKFDAAGRQFSGSSSKILRDFAWF